jgi:hypothetical protein
MMDGSRLIRYVNGSAKTTPMIKPRPGMMETAIPISNPSSSIAKSSGPKMCSKPAPR